MITLPGGVYCIFLLSEPPCSGRCGAPAPPLTKPLNNEGGSDSQKPAHLVRVMMPSYDEIQHRPVVRPPPFYPRHGGRSKNFAGPVLIVGH